MLYLATPSSPEIRAAMSAGDLGCMTTPAQGNHLPERTLIGADNGKFGKQWRGATHWYDWRTTTVARYGTNRFLFGVAPDVPFNACGTLIESMPWLPRIRHLGIPAAFAAQDGSEVGLVPWDDLDVLFLAGSTAWKIGPAAQHLAHEAQERGLPVHMGRVNSRRRLRIAEAFGCTTCDGTYLAYGPDRNLPQLLTWLTEMRQEPPSFSSRPPSRAVAQ
ncbi:hypothetical protein [Streptomyces chartreusis]|uniref:hypothetical protein n=1 Tax=Streptomyces chartreusis TaxID=1969 RepID=UPI0033D9DEE3